MAGTPPHAVYKSDATRANLLCSFRQKASAVLTADCHTLLIAHLLAVRGQATGWEGVRMDPSQLIRRLVRRYK